MPESPKLATTQKLTPSLQTPTGERTCELDCKLTDPIGDKSAAFHSETLFPLVLVTRIRWPSKAAAVGPFSPLPESVASTAPVAARITVTVLSAKFGTQMLVPSKIGLRGSARVVTDRVTAPLGSNR